MAEEQLDHVNREPFNSFMERKVSMWIDAVWIGMHTMELRLLALQYNFCASQGIMADSAGQGFRGYSPIPCHCPRRGCEQTEEAPDTILFQYRSQPVRYIIEGILHELDRSGHNWKRKRMQLGFQIMKT